MEDMKMIASFKLVQKIGSGIYGEIFHVINTTTNHEVALKLVDVRSKHSNIDYEAKVYQYLLKDSSSSETCIPRFYSFTTDEKYYILEMEVLGPSLEDLFSKCNRKLSLKTILMLADQMLSCIEFVHSKFILHRDIKPADFLIGHGSKKDRVYLIDFGLAKKYVDKDGTHILEMEGKKLIGHSRFGSVNKYLGKEHGRRDDLESLGYVIIYLLKGSMPWDNVSGADKKDKYEKIKQKKIGTTVETLCEGLPEEFAIYLGYCRNLKFEEKPDYGYLRNLLRDLFIKSGHEFDYKYDWTLL